jgi:hypothetical protein
MSHKTLYIDIDEEITSIVDRLRKAQANEVIIVVPKQALLIQSLVNLKLLKKEATRRKKKLMIVTQDRIGKKLIEKAGILVQGKAAGDFSDGDKLEETVDDAGQKSAQNDNQLFEDDEEIDIGSSDYFDEPLPAAPAALEKSATADSGENIGKISFEEQKERTVVEKNPKKTAKPAGKIPQKPMREKTVRMSDIVVNPKPRKTKKSKPEPVSLALPAENPDPPAPKRRQFSEREAKRQKNIKPEEYFRVPQVSSPSFSRKKEEKILKTTRVKGKSGKYFFVFIVAAFLVLGATAGAYFTLPSATIVLHLKTEKKSVSASVEAAQSASGVEKESGKIPAEREQITKEKSGEFDATGSKSGAGKSSGKVVIYNEFSAQDQPLVATTRLEAEDGKIFRITKNIVVPGMSKIGAETKPGATEVDVVADKPGETYNIEAATFKIPGFKGGPKYEKFYAKSAKAMEGGLNGESVSISSQDVAQAKEKLLAEAKEEALADLKKSIGGGRFFFEDTAVADLTNSSSSASVGSQAQKFTYTVSVKAQVLSFLEDDVKELIRKKESSGASGARMSFDEKLNYILSESDIEKGFLKFEARADTDSSDEIDIANFKKGILGKNGEDLAAFIKNYPAIKSADVNFWPFFASKVPMSERRVKIEIK